MLLSQGFNKRRSETDAYLCIAGFGESVFSEAAA